MAKQRLLNCDFINASSFKVEMSNKAKLLYLFMFANGDDRGFVDNTNELIKTLQENDIEFRNEINLELLNNDYQSALKELIDKGLIYEFNNNHKNKVHLIRHWYYHNKLRQGLWTNYYKYLCMVEVVNNEYVLKEKPLKEKKLNENKLNEIKTIPDNSLIYDNELTEPITTLEDFLKSKRVEKYSDLTEEQKKEWEEIVNSISVDEDDLPF